MPRAAAPRERPESSRRFEWWNAAAGIGTLAVSAWWLARLAPWAAAARLQSDECFHATMAEWIAAHHALPAVIPGLYSGLFYYYPPLYHLVGAAAIALLGVPAFKLVNVAVSGAILAVSGFGASRLAGPAAGRWAVCLCAANAWLSYHAVRMYVEQLSTLLALAAVLLVVAFHRTPRTRTAVALGLVVGLALVAKQSSLVLLALVLGLAVLERIRGRRDRARGFAVAALVGLLVSAPMFVRNAVLYGSPIYPALAPDLHPLLYRLNAAKYSLPAGTFYFTMALYIGPAIGAFVLTALLGNAVSRRVRIETGLLVFCLVLVLAGPLQPLLDPRHLLPVIVTLAVLGAIVVADALRRRPVVVAALDVFLIAMAAYFVLGMDHYRTLLDLPADNDPVMAAVREYVPERETVLSLYTYDTYYYTRRASTWPIPWGQKDHPLEMFETRDCDSVMTAFRKHDLRYALIPRTAAADTFDGANFPRPLLQCMQDLYEQHQVAVLWHSPTTALVRIGP